MIRDVDMKALGFPIRGPEEDEEDEEDGNDAQGPDDYNDLGQRQEDGSMARRMRTMKSSHQAQSYPVLCSPFPNWVKSSFPNWVKSSNRTLATSFRTRVTLIDRLVE